MTIGHFCQLVMANQSGIAKEAFVTTFAFKTPFDLDDARAQADMAAINHFYKSLATGATTVIEDYLGGQVSRGVDQCQVKCYNIPNAPGPMGSPAFIKTFQLSAARPVLNLPSEVACRLSVHADLTGQVEEGALEQIPSDRSAIRQGAPATHLGQSKPRARRRGGFFVGPLNANALTDVGASVFENRPKPAFRTDLVKAAHAMQLEIGTWAIFSRRDWSLRLITGASVDDAFDTQERRGPRPTVKTVENF